MSKYLLDTNVALLAGKAPNLLTDQVRNALLEGQNVLSVVSYWEVVLKSMKGKLDVGDLPSWWAMSMKQFRAKQLVINDIHVAAVSSLPPIHHDPFGRMLLAQAKVSGLVLLTTDSIIQLYSGEKIRVLV